MLSPNTKKNLEESILELIRVTSTVIPDDIQKVILKSLRKEQKNTTAKKLVTELGAPS